MCELNLAKLQMHQQMDKGIALVYKHEHMQPQISHSTLAVAAAAAAAAAWLNLPTPLNAAADCCS